ncbi:MAG: hypothetical protein WC205_10585 [Opitutaceae bacterium]|jgi:hypothetical protein
MHKYKLTLLVITALVASAASAQTINVTPTGVDIGAPNATTAGSLFQQVGPDTLFWTQDGVNVPDLRMTIKANGNVGIGTNTPTQKLEVAGNTVTTGSATVGSLVVGTSAILSVGKFESAEQTVPTTGNTVTIAHGLGGMPVFVTVVLRCKTAEFGWAVGDEIMLNSVTMDSVNLGITTGVNDTSIKLTVTGNIYLHKFDTAAKFAPTSANWKLVFRAWR